MFVSRPADQNLEVASQVAGSDIMTYVPRVETPAVPQQVLEYAGSIMLEVNNPGWSAEDETLKTQI